MISYFIFILLLIQTVHSFSPYVSCQSRGNAHVKTQELSLLGFSKDLNFKRRCNICISAKQENEEFWEAQRKVANTVSEALEKEEKGNSRQKYQNQVVALVSETVYFSILFFSIIWYLVPNPLTAISYMLGASLGTAYTYGLGKYVETIGGNAFDQEDVKGSGVGSARFAFLILLFVVVGKFRSSGLQEIPAIMGFFTYQLSSLSQGLKDASTEDY